MLAMIDEEERVLEVYQMFKNAMHKYGRNISFPNKTDPRKTYSWRYLTNFIKKVDKLELGPNVLPQVINAIVEHAKDNNMIHRGIAVLDQKDILDICYVKFERDARSEDNEIMNIKSSHEFVSTHRDGTKSLIQLLSERKNRLAYANIVSWYKAGYVTIGYIAVSKACRKALVTLQKHELELFPTQRELLKIRLRHVYDKNIVVKLRSFMGSDLFEE